MRWCLCRWRSRNLTWSDWRESWRRKWQRWHGWRRLCRAARWWESVCSYSTDVLLSQLHSELSPVLLARRKTFPHGIFSFFAHGHLPLLAFLVTLSFLFVLARHRWKWTAAWRLCRQRRSAWCDLWGRRRQSCHLCGRRRSCSSRRSSRSGRGAAGSWESCRASWGRRSVRTQEPPCVTF